MNDKEIRIDGLTPEQVQMLDMMWSIDSYQDYQDWLDSMSYEEAQMAEQLQTLLILATMDEAFEVDACTEAREYLKKFQL